MANPWAVAARRHWQEHLPDRFMTIEDLDAFFERLGQQADERYLAVRDGLLEGVSPDNEPTGWAGFQDRVAQADRTAREVVERELIYLAPESQPTQE